MRFAVVGDLDEVLPYLCAIDESPEDELICGCTDGPLAHRLMQRGIVIPALPSHDEVIVRPDIDAVIVAVSRADDSIHAARRASQEDRHVVALLPEAASTAYSYELHLLLDESRSGIICLAGRWFCDAADSDAPSAARLRRTELTLPISTSAERQRRWQLHAIDAICGLGCRFTQVTGMDLAGGETGPSARTVTLAASTEGSAASPPATIRFEDESAAAACLRLTYDDGSIRSVNFWLPDSTRAGHEEFGDVPLSTLRDTLQSPAECQRQMEQLSISLELLEGLDKSLRRRRTVDVHREGVSERAVFKTQMTAIGCGVLAWLIFGMVAYLMAAHVLKPPQIVLQIGRIVWIGPLILFLVAQFLLPLARDRSGGTTNSSDEIDDTD